MARCANTFPMVQSQFHLAKSKVAVQNVTQTHTHRPPQAQSSLLAIDFLFFGFNLLFVVGCAIWSIALEYPQKNRDELANLVCCCYNSVRFWQVGFPFGFINAWKTPLSGWVSCEGTCAGYVLEQETVPLKRHPYVGAIAVSTNQPPSRPVDRASQKKKTNEKTIQAYHHGRHNSTLNSIKT